MAAQNKHKSAVTKRFRSDGEAASTGKNSVQSAYMKEKQELEAQSRTDKHAESSKWLVR